MKDDLIFRRDAIMALGEFPYNWNNSPEELQEVSDFECHFNALEKVPAVDAVPVVHGRAVWKNPLDSSAKVCIWRCSSYCSICGEYVAVSWKYCPNCGAKLDI